MTSSTLIPLATPALSPMTPFPGLNGVPLCIVTSPGPLPSAQNFVRQTRTLEERQVVDVSQVEQVALVEVGTGAGPGQVVGIQDDGVPRGGRIIDGMAVGVSQAQLQPADVVPHRSLQRVVGGRGLLSQRGAPTLRPGTGCGKDPRWLRMQSAG